MNKEKKVKLVLALFLTIITIFGFRTKAEALCSSKKYSNLKMTAYKSELSYQLNFDENRNYYFLLTLNNVDKDIIVKFDGYEYEPDNGTVELDTKVYGGQTYEIYLYGGYDTACPEEYLYTKRITVPKYNIYSERDECIEYEEFYLCNKWYAGEVGGEESFLNQLDAYIETLKKKDDELTKKENKSIIDNLIEFFNNNKIIIIPILVVVALLIVYKIIVRIIRRRNRIKLNSK